MTTINTINDFFNKQIPYNAKYDFDNVGLLFGFPSNTVENILVCLDITDQTIDEAIRNRVNLIVSHHPVIFTPLKKIDASDSTGSRLIKLAQNSISAICLHTNFDRWENGVNHALCESLGLTEIGNFDCGSIGFLNTPSTMPHFLSLIMDKLDPAALKYHSSETPISKIAVCGGAGGDLIYEAAECGCDTVITGEVKHHQWLDAKALKINLIEAGHYSTEKPAMKIIADLLREYFPEINIYESSSEVLPYQIFSHKTEF